MSELTQKEKLVMLAQYSNDRVLIRIRSGGDQPDIIHLFTLLRRRVGMISSESSYIVWANSVITTTYNGHEPKWPLYKIKLIGYDNSTNKGLREKILSIVGDPSVEITRTHTNQHGVESIQGRLLFIYGMILATNQFYTPYDSRAGMTLTNRLEGVLNKYTTEITRSTKVLAGLV
jgi:hypothetical protein